MLSIFSCACRLSVCRPWKNVSSGLLCPFLIGLFAFSLLSRVSCLYILGINPLLVISSANIFSDLVGCLFVLLMVSCGVSMSCARKQSAHLWFMLTLAWTQNTVWGCNRIIEEFTGMKNHSTQSSPRVSTVRRAVHPWQRQVMGWIFIPVRAVTVILHVDLVHMLGVFPPESLNCSYLCNLGMLHWWDISK